MVRPSLLLSLLLVQACGRPPSHEGTAPRLSRSDARLLADSTLQQIYHAATESLFAEGAPDSLVLDALDAPDPPFLAISGLPGSPILDEWSTRQRASAREALDDIENARPRLTLLRGALEARGIRVLDGAAVPMPTLADDPSGAYPPRLRVWGIGFSSDSGTAALYAVSWCGTVCGSGVTIVLVRDASGAWVVLNKHVGWVS